MNECWQMSQYACKNLQTIKDKRLQKIFSVQVNGGSIEEKVDFGYNLFEQTVSVDCVFQQNEMLDTIAITKGKGTEGVVPRWGVTRLPRKTHRELRKVKDRPHQYNDS